MVAVGILTVLRGLVIKTRVGDDGHAVRGLIGNPEFIGATGMKLKVGWASKVVESVGDDHFHETIAKGLDDL